MHKKLGKVLACGLGDMLADRQTHRHTCSLQYFATTPAGEVTKMLVGKITYLLVGIVA